MGKNLKFFFNFFSYIILKFSSLLIKIAYLEKYINAAAGYKFFER